MRSEYRTQELHREEALTISEDDRIILDAKKKFEWCQNWENDFRRNYVNDIQFANADPDNGWQWPSRLLKDRISAERPALTVNKTAQHVLQIVNDSRKNKPSIKVSPVGETVSFKAAEVYESLFRNIEYNSKAQRIYDDAVESQVEGGIGYWRVLTEYADEKTFDQVIKIVPVKHHLQVFMDPNIKQRDGSDAQFAFVFDEMARKEAETLWPDVDVASGPQLGENDNWVSEYNVRIAEFFRIVRVDDALVEVRDQHGISSVFLMSDIPRGWERREDIERLVEKRRKVRRPQLEWFKIVGSVIVDRRDGRPQRDGGEPTQPMQGRYIPIVRLPGREKIIDGKLHRTGHVRQLKDAQRMYNYNTSAQVEFGALQTKTPWVAPAEAIEGNEPAWFASNIKNAAVLPYKGFTKDGQAIPAPTRPDAPTTAPAFEMGIRVAAAEMEMASGQYAAQQQNPLLERSPRAITERVHLGETSTYHFLDNLAMAIQFTAAIVIDLAPYIYDTKRVLKIMAKDGTEQAVTVDPNASDAYTQRLQPDSKIIEILFNPKMGEYSVQADIGPAYQTQRQEAFNAFVQIISSSPELINIIGDLMFRSADFPMADLISERIKRHITQTAPWLLDDQTIGPMIQQLQGEVTDKTQQISDLLQRLAEERLRIKGKDAKDDIAIYDAETRRLTGVTNAVVDAAKSGDLRPLRAVMQQVLSQMLGFNVAQVVDAGQEQLGGPEPLNPEPPDPNTPPPEESRPGQERTFQ
jgi:hypothetical protein